MRLSADGKKDYNKLETELRKEFKEGTSNREAALNELKGVKYKGHSIITHAYNIMELVKLAYPTFNSASMQIVVIVYLINSLHRDMLNGYVVSRR